MPNFGAGEGGIDAAMAAMGSTVPLPRDSTTPAVEAMGGRDGQETEGRRGGDAEMHDPDPRDAVAGEPSQVAQPQPHLEDDSPMQRGEPVLVNREMAQIPGLI